MARVLPDVAGFERELDYEVPSALADEVRVGTIVRVPTSRPEGPGVGP